jgi:hypothetical protein
MLTNMLTTTMAALAPAIWLELTHGSCQLPPVPSLPQHLAQVR